MQKNGTIPAFGIHPDRIKLLNDKPVNKGRYVLYWMQHAQRSEWNHALEYAAASAEHYNTGLLVVFCLDRSYPDANQRHYKFMLEGLRDISEALSKRRVRFAVLPGKAVKCLRELANEAKLVVCDRAYLKHLRLWRKELAEQCPCRLIQLETDLIIPVEKASEKREYAARTIRKKLSAQLPFFCCEFNKHGTPKKLSVSFDGEIDLNMPDILDGIPILRDPRDETILLNDNRFFTGGCPEAQKRFRSFLENGFHHYVENRNQPQTDDISHMSPYLHFGQISPLWLLRELESVSRGDAGLAEAKDAYIEELLVQRELAYNYVFYETAYETYKALPSWAQESLAEHSEDRRPQIYSLEELERAGTYDEYWNAAMREMVLTGFMHNYMRMYWGKKILEWSLKPEEAFSRILYLNNKYFIDGRDPNSYSNTGWIFGLHDRPWKERAIYGKVRIMTASGLERKADISAYVQKVNDMENA